MSNSRGEKLYRHARTNLQDNFCCLAVTTRVSQKECEFVRPGYVRQESGHICQRQCQNMLANERVRAYMPLLAHLASLPRGLVFWSSHHQVQLWSAARTRRLGVPIERGDKSPHSELAVCVALTDTGCSLNALLSSLKILSGDSQAARSFISNWKFHLCQTLML